MVALAYLSKSKSLFHLSLLIAAGWTLGNGLDLAELLYGYQLAHFRPIVDASVFLAIVTLAFLPKTASAPANLFVAFMFLVQLATRYLYTREEALNPENSSALHYQKDLTLNIEFLVICLSVMLVAIFRMNRESLPNVLRPPDKQKQKSSRPTGLSRHVVGAFAFQNRSAEEQPKSQTIPAPTAQAVTIDSVRFEPKTFSKSIRDIAQEVEDDE